MKLKEFKEVENLTTVDRKEYFEKLHSFCNNRHVKKQTNQIILWIIAKLSPLFRGFEIEYEGLENISDDETLIFLCNHSNSHDFFVIRETFDKLHRNVTPLGAWDGLNFLSRHWFKLGNVTLIKRDSKESKERGILDYCTRILHGDNGFIFGEATWNLHPIKPMQNVKAGVTEVALITGKRIVPTIFEYIEVDGLCKKESKLYTKCIVSFGKPVTVVTEKSIFEQTHELQKTMEEMRRKIWDREGIIRDKLSDVDSEVYINHTYLKKFKAFGFKYDTSLESQFLLKRDNYIENEYYMDDRGNLVPGILPSKKNSDENPVKEIIDENVVNLTD